MIFESFVSCSGFPPLPQPFRGGTIPHGQPTSVFGIRRINRIGEDRIGEDRTGETPETDRLEENQSVVEKEARRAEEEEAVDLEERKRKKENNEWMKKSGVKKTTTLEFSVNRSGSESISSQRPIWWFAQQNRIHSSYRDSVQTTGCDG
jgi:hypothetical protein